MITIGNRLCNCNRGKKQLHTSDPPYLFPSSKYLTWQFADKLKQIPSSYLQLMNRYFQIGLIELIVDVPTKRPVLSPLLYSRMKEAESKEQLLPVLDLLLAILPARLQLLEEPRVYKRLG